jgi:hypothetical protein
VSVTVYFLERTIKIGEIYIPQGKS